MNDNEIQKELTEMMKDRPRIFLYIISWLSTFLILWLFAFNILERTSQNIFTFLFFLLVAFLSSYKYDRRFINKKETKQ